MILENKLKIIDVSDRMDGFNFYLAILLCDVEYKDIENLITKMCIDEEIEDDSLIMIDTLLAFGNDVDYRFISMIWAEGEIQDCFVLEQSMIYLDMKKETTNFLKNNPDYIKNSKLSDKEKGYLDAGVSI